MKNPEAFFQARYSFLLFLILGVDISELIENRGVLHPELIVLKFQFLAPILLDDVSQFLQAIFGLIEVTFVNLGDLLKFLQFLRSGLFFLC